ncbi:MAG: GntR family transcriptional regulator [bacterium]|nr:GntR family transcriptional regulator [bacterium]
MEKMKMLKEPAYIRIKQELKRGILSGAVKSFSEREIIYRYNVSNTTARRVLNELEEEGLLERKVGYGSIVKTPGKSLNKEVGIVFFNIYDWREPFISRIVSGIEEEARNDNYHLHLYTTREKPILSNKNSTLYHIVSKRKIDGLIILSPLPSSDIRFFIEERIPVVSVYNVYSDKEVACISFDFNSTIKDVCEILYGLEKKKIVVAVGGEGRLGIKRSREYVIDGYKEFVEGKGVVYEGGFIKENVITQADGYELMREYYELSEGIRPDALIFVSVMAGEGAMRFMKETKTDGWKPTVIPFVAMHISYPLYIYLPYERLGKVAFELLKKQIFEKKREKIFLPVEVVYKRSNVPVLSEPGGSV